MEPVGFEPLVGQIIITILKNYNYNNILKRFEMSLIIEILLVKKIHLSLILNLKNIKNRRKIYYNL
jgi:hypothetical protein